MKFTASSTALLALVLPTLALAAIEPKVVFLSANTSDVNQVQSYLVPTNKIFVIENILPSDRDKDLMIRNTNLFVEIFFKLKRNETFEEIINLQPSLKIPGGWTLAINEEVINNEESLDIALFGLLVDAEDLYAGISSTVEKIAQTGPGTLETTVGLDAGRQAIVKVEESLDLASWVERTDVTEALGASQSERILTLPLNTSVPVAFQRAMIRSRRGSASMPH